MLIPFICLVRWLAMDEAPDAVARTGRGAGFGPGAICVFVTACLLFNLSFFRLLSFPMTALSNIGVYAFACGGFYLLSRNRLILAALLLTLSALSQANGLAATPVAVAYLLVHRRWRDAAIFLGLALVVTVLYLTSYSLHAGMSPMLHEAAGPAQGAAPLWTHAAYFFIQIGSLVGVNHKALHLPLVLLIFPFAVGAGLLAAHVWLWREGTLKAYPGVAMLLLFLLAAFAAISVARVDPDAGEWLQARYKLISCLYAAGVVGLLLRRFSPWLAWRPRLGQVVVAAAAMFWLGTMIFLVPHVQHFRAFTRPLATETWTPVDQAAARQLLQQAAQDGVYRWSGR